MRIARRLALLAAVSALAAPAASAQTEPLTTGPVPRLIVQQEVHATNDVNCPAVTPSPIPVPGPMTTGGGCRVHVASPANPHISFIFHLSAGGTEVITANCAVEFDMRINAVEAGYLSHQEFSGDPVVCTKRPCGHVAGGEARAWSFFVRESEVAGQTPREHLTMLFCTENLDGTAVSHCEITIPFSQPTAHRYRVQANDTPGHGSALPHCEVTGTLDFEAAGGTSGESEATQNVEIRHT
jgi:hypothetical protein